MLSKLKQLNWQWRCIRFALPAAGIVIVARLAGLLQGYELEVFDLYTRWRPQEPSDERIVIVGIEARQVILKLFLLSMY